MGKTKTIGLLDFKVEMVPVADLIPYNQNPKAHPEAQVNKIASSIKNFGVLKNIVIDDKNEVVAGHGSLLAYQKLGVGVIPCVRASHLSPAQIKAFRIADNKTAESEWFPETLALELQALQEMDFDLSLTGFDKEELDRFLEVIPDVEFKEYDESVENEVEYIECPECHHKWPK